MKRRSKYSGLIKAVIMVLPFVVSMIGYMAIEHEEVIASIYNSILYYVLNNADRNNILLLIAMFAAPVMTASFVVTLARSLVDGVRNSWRYLAGDSIAVYGDDAEAADLVAELGKRCIRGGEEFVNAGSYIFLWNEEKSLDFYRAHKEDFAGRKVYIESRSDQAVSDDGFMRTFCSEDTGARLYWKQAKMYEIAKKSGNELNIVMVGFDLIQEKLLLHGLQTNLFSKDQKVTYHIFGDGHYFKSIYHELDEISDDIIFHDEPWYENCSVIVDAEKVIVVDDIEIIRDILFAVPEKKVDYLTDDPEALWTLSPEDKNRLNVFLWKKEAGKLKNIVEEGLFETAKRINLAYEKKYSAPGAVTDDMKDSLWEKLDAFTRRSNIGAADFHEIRMQMMVSDGYAKNVEPEELEPEYFELHSCLEHERWMRFHYLNNWRFGQPENGKSKDKIKRIHADLVPYDKLTEEEKQKDRDNINVLMTVKL